MSPLFTIGHSTHEFSTFLDLLVRHEIEWVADVRSNPASRLPWFSRAALQHALKAAGLRYVFLGDELGARRAERECYVGHRADYGLIAKTPAFQHGLDRLQKGVKDYRIALMCSEREPLDCHRTILVSREAKPFADVFHIKADGQLETHADAEKRLVARYFDPDGDLFRSDTQLLNDAYDRRGKEINYVEDAPGSAILREEPFDDEY